MEDTVKVTLRQIREKKYVVSLTVKGICGERVRRYGFAFREKEVLIGEE